MNKFKPGDRVTMEEGDCFGSTQEVTVMKAYKGGNYLVREGNGDLRETGERQLTLVQAREDREPAEPEKCLCNGATAVYINRLEAECRVLVAVIENNPSSTQIALNEAKQATSLMLESPDLNVTD